jgi:hypothetical protein
MVYMHKRIKRFELIGVIADDSFILRMKEQYIKLISDLMKDEGYVQRIDIDPDWSLSYEDNHYNFILSVYGAYVGKKQAGILMGLDKNRGISKKESSENVQKMPIR